MGWDVTDDYDTTGRQFGPSAMELHFPELLTTLLGQKPAATASPAQCLSVSSDYSLQPNWQRRELVREWL